MELNSIQLAIILWTAVCNVILMAGSLCALAYRTKNMKKNEYRHWVRLDYVQCAIYISIVCTIPAISMSAQLLYRSWFG
jgi:heme/copper-type cytochrome/quinol oxidase subunit 2